MCNCNGCQRTRQCPHAGPCSCRARQRTGKEALLGDEFGGRTQLFPGPSPEALLRSVPPWSGWVYGGNTLASINAGQRVSNYTPNLARRLPVYLIVNAENRAVYLGLSYSQKSNALERRIRRHFRPGPIGRNDRVYVGTVETGEPRLAHVVESLLQRHYGRPVYNTTTRTFDEADESLEGIVNRQIATSNHAY
jgi:hypothetical protein